VSRLRDLDERWVPAVARRLRALTNGLTSLGDSLGNSLGDRFAREVPGTREDQVEVVPERQKPLERRSLRSLDERFASSGPLALFREVPQVGFVVVGLVFLAATGTVVSRRAADTRANSQDTVVAPAGTAVGDGGGSSILGPQPGDSVTTYLAAAAGELRQVGKGAARVSLVNLAGFQNQQQAVATVAGLDVLEVFLRSTAGGKDATEIASPISGEFSTGLTKAYADAARGRHEAQKSYQGYVDTLTVTTKEDQQFKDYYRMFARSTAAEAAALDRNCACVYALVVTATPQQLQTLASRPGVRSVQVAKAGLGLKDVQVLPLLPTVKGIVPERQTTSPP
jgi:hypothetical protein